MDARSAPWTSVMPIFAALLPMAYRLLSLDSIPEPTSSSTPKDIVVRALGTWPAARIFFGRGVSIMEKEPQQGPTTTLECLALVVAALLQVASLLM